MMLYFLHTQWKIIIFNILADQHGFRTFKKTPLQKTFAYYKSLPSKIWEIQTQNLKVTHKPDPISFTTSLQHPIDTTSLTTQTIVPPVIEDKPKAITVSTSCAVKSCESPRQVYHSVSIYQHLTKPMSGEDLTFPLLCFSKKTKDWGNGWEIKLLKTRKKISERSQHTLHWPNRTSPHSWMGPHCSNNL